MPAAARTTVTRSSSGSSSGATVESFTDAWEAALADLELEVDRAEALLRSAEPALPETSPWTAPTGLGPLPGDLLGRATALHERQLRVTREIVEALTRTRAQAAVAARIETGRVAGPARYVDRAC